MPEEGLSAVTDGEVIRVYLAYPVNYMTVGITVGGEDDGLPVIELVYPEHTYPAILAIARKMMGASIKPRVCFAMEEDPVYVAVLFLIEVECATNREFLERVLTSRSVERLMTCPEERVAFVATAECDFDLALIGAFQVAFGERGFLRLTVPEIYGEEPQANWSIDLTEIEPRLPVPEEIVCPRG